MQSTPLPPSLANVPKEVLEKYIQARIQAQLAEVARNRFKDVPAEVLERAQQKALEMPLQLEHLQLQQPEQASKDVASSSVEAVSKGIEDLKVQEASGSSSHTAV